MATAQLESLTGYRKLIQPLNNATKDAYNGYGGLVLIINPIFVVEIFCFCLFADELTSTMIFCLGMLKKMILWHVI